ncbi:dTMP kinase [Corynebacterium sp. ZY180755]
MIISIEGIDGAGKNTLVTALKDRFNATVIAFPRYEESIHAQLVQDALYGRMGDLTDSAYAMATLFALDRHGAREDIRAASERGVVLLDRFVASNAAYTAARLEDPGAVDFIAELEFERLAVPRPDLQILLHTPPSLARERAASREAQDASRTRDRYESDTSLQDRTSEMYEKLAGENWVSPWLIVTPEMSPETVADTIANQMAH